MSLLNSLVEDRAGVYVVIDRGTGAIRPATSFEVELWQYANRGNVPTRESYVRVNEGDLLRLMQEVESARAEIHHLREQLIKKGLDEPGSEKTG